MNTCDMQEDFCADGPTQEESADPRRKYYVTVIRSPGPRQKVGFLAGPFDTHEQAKAKQSIARAEAIEIDPRAVFDYFGTAGVVADKHAPGVLNTRLGLS
jgi:hypothetical protein